MRFFSKKFIKKYFPAHANSIKNIKVVELEGTIDELEDKLYAEKLKIKQTVEDMDATIHASAL